MVEVLDVCGGSHSQAWRSQIYGLQREDGYDVCATIDDGRRVRPQRLVLPFGHPWL